MKQESPAFRHGECQEAFVASVESALRETIVVWEEEEYHDIATRVTDRIIDKI